MKQPSEFASTLKKLMNVAGYSVTEWSNILNVREYAVWGWFMDAAFPSPETMRRIVRTLEENSNITDEMMEEFETMSDKNLYVISPWLLDARTLSEYMTQPIREAFMRTLDTVRPDLQEKVLLEAAELARHWRDKQVPRPSVKERRQKLRNVV